MPALRFPEFASTSLGTSSGDWVEIKLEQIGKVIRGSSPRPKGDLRYFGGKGYGIK